MKSSEDVTELVSDRAYTMNFIQKGFSVPIGAVRFNTKLLSIPEYKKFSIYQRLKAYLEFSSNLS